MSGRARVLLTAVLFLVAGVVAFVISGWTSIADVRVNSYQLTADPRQIVANVTVGLSYEITEHSAREDGSTVILTVPARRPGGSWPAIAINIPVPITLQADIAERAVSDSFGSAVPQHGTYRAP